jgi:hypothetical protein
VSHPPVVRFRGYCYFVIQSCLTHDCHVSLAPLFAVVVAAVARNVRIVIIASDALEAVAFLVRIPATPFESCL